MESSWSEYDAKTGQATSRSSILPVYIAIASNVKNYLKYFFYDSENR